MTSSPAPRSPSRAKWTIEEIEEAVEAIGGLGVFFHHNGAPLGNHFVVQRQCSLEEFARFVYGDEPTLPEPDRITLLIDRHIICQKSYWCFTYNGLLIGDPIPDRSR